MSEDADKVTRAGRWRRRLGLHLRAEDIRVRSTPALIFTSAVMLFFAALAALTTVIGARHIAEQFYVGWSWPTTTARVLSARETYSNRGVRKYDLQLQASGPGGAVLHGNSIASHQVSSSWSTPLRVPRPGDEVRVHFDPANPSRMFPERAMRGRWLVVLLPLLVYGTVYLVFAAVTHMRVASLRRESAPP